MGEQWERSKSATLLFGFTVTVAIVSARKRSAAATSHAALMSAFEPNQTCGGFEVAPRYIRGSAPTG